MTDVKREYREPNLVDAIETGAGILTSAVNGTFLMAQTVSGSVPKFGNPIEGGFGMKAQEVQGGQQFGHGPERGG